MDKVLPIFCDFWFGHVDFINVVNARLLRMMRYCSLFLRLHSHNILAILVNQIQLQILLLLRWWQSNALRQSWRISIKQQPLNCSVAAHVIVVECTQHSPTNYKSDEINRACQVLIGAVNVPKSASWFTCNQLSNSQNQICNQMS
jgi:hypothetical protein